MKQPSNVEIKPFLLNFAVVETGDVNCSTKGTTNITKPGESDQDYGINNPPVKVPTLSLNGLSCSLTNLN
jgi:hypothetical protein